MNLNPAIFKTYDIRGIVPTDIDETFARRLGSAFVTYLKKQGVKNNDCTVVVGRDNRLSSDALADALIDGVRSVGGNVVDCGICSTPMFDWVVLAEKYAGGIMVTASHNPPEYNGFKMMGPGITPIGLGSGMEDLRALMEGNLGTETAAEGKLARQELLNEYVSANLAQVAPVAGVEKLKVVVDTGNGVSALMIQELFNRLPCTLVPLFFELDGTFPSHQPNPLVEENMRFLKAKILEEKADIGVGLDTDGDRLVFMDETGTMTNDVTIALLAKGFLASHPGEKILYDIRSSHVVPESIREAGGIPIATPIGHTLIKQAMKAEDGYFAGELSGHFYFRDMGNFEAPLMVLVTALNVLAQSGKKFSELTAPLRRYAGTGEINFKVEDKAGALQRLERHFDNAPTISHLDGITIEYPDWWFNVRASNTENVLRLNLEANTPDLKNAKLAQVQAIIIEK